MAKKISASDNAVLPAADFTGLLADVVSLLESAHRTSVRAVNAVMTATYWEIGRRIVEVEQRGDQRADYGDEMIKRLAIDLSAHFGRGFAWRNVYQMRAFHLAYRNILQTLSAKSGDSNSADDLTKLSTASAFSQPPVDVIDSSLGTTAKFFQLP